LASERQVPAVPHESPDQLHASYTPVAARPIIRRLAGLSQEIETPLVSTTCLWITTRQRRFTFVRLSDPYLPEVRPRRFDPNAHHHGSLPQQLGVVWSLLL